MKYTFDSGPLSAFALVGRVDLLKARYEESISWTIEVQAELKQGVDRYPELADILEADWMPSPERIDAPEELLELERTRWAIGGDERNPADHRGEASVITLVERGEAVAVIDDMAARSLCALRGLPLVGTLGILQACVRDRQLSPEEAWELFTQMRENGVYLPNWVTLETFQG
jgi:pentatricopeptide repeat protein